MGSFPLPRLFDSNAPNSRKGKSMKASSTAAEKATKEAEPQPATPARAQLQNAITTTGNGEITDAQLEAIDRRQNEGAIEQITLPIPTECDTTVKLLFGKFMNRTEDETQPSQEMWATGFRVSTKSLLYEDEPNTDPEDISTAAYTTLAEAIQEACSQVQTWLIGEAGKVSRGDKNAFAVHRAIGEWAKEVDGEVTESIFDDPNNMIGQALASIPYPTELGNECHQTAPLPAIGYDPPEAILVVPIELYRQAQKRIHELERQLRAGPPGPTNVHPLDKIIGPEGSEESRQRARDESDRLNAKLRNAQDEASANATPGLSDPPSPRETIDEPWRAILLEAIGGIPAKAMEILKGNLVLTIGDYLDLKDKGISYEGAKLTDIRLKKVEAAIAAHMDYLAKHPPVGVPVVPAAVIEQEAKDRLATAMQEAAAADPDPAAQPAADENLPAQKPLFDDLIEEL